MLPRLPHRSVASQDHPPDGSVIERAIARVVPVAAVVLGLLGVATVVLGFALLRSPEGRALIREYVRPSYRIAATSITPITTIAGGASGFEYSGDAYDVACTVSGSVTLYPAVYDSNATPAGW